MTEKNDSFMKKIIIIMAIFLLIFTIVMIVTYFVKDGVPEALIVAVFAACLGEGTITGMIQKTKLNLSSEEDEEECDNNEEEEIIE